MIFRKVILTTLMCLVVIVPMCVCQHEHGMSHDEQTQSEMPPVDVMDAPPRQHMPSDHDMTMGHTMAPQMNGMDGKSRHALHSDHNIPMDHAAPMNDMDASSEHSMHSDHNMPMNGMAGPVDNGQMHDYDIVRADEMPHGQHSNVTVPMYHGDMDHGHARDNLSNSNHQPGHSTHDQQNTKERPYNVIAVATLLAAVVFVSLNIFLIWFLRRLRASTAKREREIQAFVRERKGNEELEASTLITHSTVSHSVDESQKLTLQACQCDVWKVQPGCQDDCVSKCNCSSYPQINYDYESPRCNKDISSVFDSLDLNKETTL